MEKTGTKTIDMVPNKSPSIKGVVYQAEFSFAKALDIAIAGSNVRRMAWEDESIYLCFKDNNLMIHLADGLLHPLTVSVGDVQANDWIIHSK